MSRALPETSVPHVPVLLEEAVAAIAPAPGCVLVDATFGAGGYTRRLLDAGATVHACRASWRRRCVTVEVGIE